MRRKPTLFARCLLAAAAVGLFGLTSVAGERYVTLTSTWSQTNTLDIAEGEVGELASFTAAFNRGRQVSVFRRGRLLTTVTSAFSGDGGVGRGAAVVVTGPARFALDGAGVEGFPPIFCTIRVFPDHYLPTGTVVIPPGEGGGVIGLECSTDLVAWQTATNGLYLNEPTAKFFRTSLIRIFPGQAVSGPASVTPPDVATSTGSAALAFNGRRYLTWVPDPVWDGAKLDIPEGEAIKVVTLFDGGALFVFEKNGNRYFSDSYAPTKEDPLVIAGPARFNILGFPAMTLERMQNAADPATTVVVPPGSAGGRIQLQSSTNLTDWASADLGAYTNLTAATFFRISLERLIK